MLRALIFLTCLWTHVTLAHEGNHAPQNAVAMTELKEQIANYQKRLSQNPTDINAMLNLGELFEKLGRATSSHGDFAKSSSYFEKALAMNPDSQAGLNGICRTALARHQFKRGLAHARNLAEIAPDALETQLLLGDAHFFLGHYAEAEAFFEKALAACEYLGTLARIAQLHEARGRYDQARLWMTKALDDVADKENRAADKAWVLTMLAELDLVSGQTDAAQTKFQKALSEDPTMHYATWRLAEIKRQSGDLQAARKMLHDLVHQQPRMAYFVSYGQLWRDLEREDRASYWFRKAEAIAQAEIDAGDYGHVRELVAIWADTGQHLDKALVLAKKEYDEIRQDTEGAEWLGWLYHLNGQSEQGMPYMRRAMRIGTATPRFTMRAALVSKGAGNVILAAQLLRLVDEAKAFVDADLVQKTKSLRTWLRENPAAIRDQFKQRARVD